MVSYDKLWITMKEKGISQYALIKEHGISSGLLDRLRKNLDTSTHSLSLLCSILNCRIEDIIEYIPENDFKESTDFKTSPDDELLLAEYPSGYNKKQ